MQRTMLKSKIHRAVITQADLYYEGSLTVDVDLMKAADMLPYEKVAVVNINNGERFETYLIPGQAGSRVICLNGAAARKGAVGDEIIIISYVVMAEEDLVNYKPTIILVDKSNNIKSRTYTIEPGSEISNN